MPATEIGWRFAREAWANGPGARGAIVVVGVVLIAGDA